MYVVESIFIFRQQYFPMLRKFLTTILSVGLFSGSTIQASEPSQNLAGPVVTVHFDYYLKDLPQIRTLEHRLDKAIKHAGAGELGEAELHLDGNDGYLYMYGTDPDRLCEVTGPILKSSKLMLHAEITKQYGSRTKTLLINRIR
jgi:hypothetical protein